MNLYDKIISYFSPKTALKNAISREHLSKIQKRSALYGAAKHSNFNHGFNPSNWNPNELIENSAKTVRARVRQLYRDFPYFYRAVNCIVDYSASNIKFRSRIKNPDGTLNRDAIQNVHDVFSRWSDAASTDGKLHFDEIIQLAKRQESEVGEFFVIKNFGGDGYLPYSLQPIEPDQISGDFTDQRIAENAKLRNGIEYDKLTGKPIAYHFQVGDYSIKTIRLPAGRVIHGYRIDRPGQLRGISPLVSAVNTAQLLWNYLDAEIGAVAMASRWLGFVTKNDPAALQSAYTTDVDDGDGDSTRFMDIETAIIEQLEPGEKIEFANPQRPSSNFQEFVKLVLRMLAVVSQVPYELLSGDYAGMNYSTMRVSRNDFSDQLRPVIRRHIQNLCWPAIIPFFQVGYLSGRLNMPGFMDDPWSYRDGIWMPPGMSPVDPLKENKADIAFLDKNLVSKHELAAKRGRDLEEVYKEANLDAELADFYGVGADNAVSTANAGAPSAVEGQK